MEILAALSQPNFVNPIATPDFRVYLDTMNWQQLVSLLIVGAAAAFFIASRLRRRKFSFERDTHCGCGGNSSVSPQNSIVFRARKGSPPEIVIKMR